ncbi:ATP-binding protein [Halanaerobium saccharolyticum]|uniref:ATP-binding protein n=1 Tax=Halanaerobium saccharolyticum TaxID=43595 RepID=UPI000DBA526E
MIKFLKKINKFDLLLINELGFFELSNQATQLMFQIFSEKYELLECYSFLLMKAVSYFLKK